MDFFEQYPDHGNGSLEALIIVVAIVLVLTLLFRRQLGGLLRRPPGPGRRPGIGGSPPASGRGHPAAAGREAEHRGRGAVVPHQQDLPHQDRP